MQIIPVIDLLQGQVVRGVAGERAKYRPIVSQIAADASPRSVARAFVERFGFDTVYVADLDAIMHGRPDFDGWRTIAACGLKLWLDAGIETAESAVTLSAQARKMGAGNRLVIGLESLAGPQELPRIREQTSEPIFSLDLKHSLPETRIAAWQQLTPLEIAAQVRAASFCDLIVLDLADVGASGGTRTLDLCRQIRQAFDFQDIIAGGGVRSLADLASLSDAGCTSALVASALHDGRL